MIDVWDYKVVAVFSTEELARAWVDKSGKNACVVIEETVLEALPTGD